MIGLLMAAALSAQVGECSPRGGPGLYWDQAARDETRARFQAVFRHVRASRAVRRYVDVVVFRESSGRPGVRHTRGAGEDGLGAAGLSLHWHADKWPGDDEDPAFCRPEVSALVVMAIIHRAVRRWNAGNLVEIQSIYSGRMKTIVLEDGRKLRAPGRTRDPGLCRRLAARGVGCLTPVSASDLGRLVPFEQRRELADRLADRWAQDHEDQ